MFKKWMAAIIGCCMILFPAVQAASADGIIIPEPHPCDPMPCPRPVMEQLTIRYHHVTVAINNQVAVTKVDQVFYNPNDYTVEGTYTFPLPAGAVVTDFKLWVDGQAVEGKVLDANAARDQYEQIVRQLRDPALLEYAGRGAVMARIYPIAPQGERRIQLEYSQVLTAEQGLVEYRYPLNTEKFSQQPLESVTVDVNILSDSPIGSVYSPTHTILVDKTNPKKVEVGYEASNLTPDSDFLLYYTIDTEEGVHLLSFINPLDVNDPDGFFLMLLTPPALEQSEGIAKDVILVLDHSGSMEGEKFRQAQSAAHFILKHLNPSDHFNLVSFSTNVETFAPAMQAGENATLGEAWIDQVSPGGSTDINSALLQAISISDSSRPTYVIFLTDGLPTHGETKTQTITDNVAEAIKPNMRLFSFGVGYDVDTTLLDTLSLDHHGSTTYVTPGQSVDDVISGFYQKISTPALTDLKAQVVGATTYDLNPNPLPDLFYGSQIVISGRYKAGGTVDIHLAGRSEQGPYDKTISGLQLSRGTEEDNSTNAYISRLWAARKIGTLLTQIRLNGPDQETIQQIVKISVRYGIVTPYTSYLVTEPDALSSTGQDRIAQQEYQAQVAEPTQVSGAGAVNKAADSGALGGAESVPAKGQSEADLIKIAGSRTFILQDGVWTDTQFDKQKMTPTKITYLTDDYFKLALKDPDVAAGLSLGSKVILVIKGQAYEIVP
jgi:Ca-activated chloride channel homolog